MQMYCSITPLATPAVAPIPCADLPALQHAGRLAHVDLATRCAGPLQAVLRRFAHSEELRISGDGSRISWGSPGSQALFPKLRCLRIAPCYYSTDPDNLAHDWVLPPSLTAAVLQAAIVLHFMELSAHWCDTVPAVCAAPLALQALGLHLWDVDKDGARSAFSVLQHLATPFGHQVQDNDCLLLWPRRGGSGLRPPNWAGECDCPHAHGPALQHPSIDEATEAGQSVLSPPSTSSPHSWSAPTRCHLPLPALCIYVHSTPWHLLLPPHSAYLWQLCAWE